MPKTQAQIDRATDARLLKKYGVGLDWYNAQLKKQGGVCAITGNPPGTRRLHIDHDHSWTKVKIKARRGVVAGYPSPCWIISAVYNGKNYGGCCGIKRTAVAAVRAQLKRASVRGLLSYSANVGLQKFSDSPEYLRAAARYLEDHKEGR